MIPAMIYSDNGEKLTKSFESCRLVAYQDGGGIWTIGWGRTKGVKEGDTCTQDQADQWLTEDLIWAIYTVNRFVHAQLTQGEFDALVDFVYNVGADNFGGSTLLRKLNQSDFLGAAQEFERWDLSKGVVVAGLLRRRIAEEGEFKQ